MGAKSKIKRRDEDTSSSSEYPGFKKEMHHTHAIRSRDRYSRKAFKEDKKRKSKHHKDRKKEKRKIRKRRDPSYESDSSLCHQDEGSSCLNPEFVIEEILKEFPGVTADLKQLLQMVDNRQAVDIRDMSETSLVSHLKQLFRSLKLEEKGSGVFFLPPNAHPTMEVVGSLIFARLDSMKQRNESLQTNVQASLSMPEHDQLSNDINLEIPSSDVEAPVYKKRVMGPEMPSAELLAAAAKLTEAQADLREADIDGDSEVLIGPPPPTMVSEFESANEAERFEEVARIMGAEEDVPYDVVGVNRNMSTDNIKKRYWKLSLLVHPDKCSHPQAHEAFVKLNKAFKDLQDPEKRASMDEKIKLEEEREEFKVELKAMLEAARWRRSQGITMAGDDELLAKFDVKAAPKRDEWMTELPPERKGGVSMQSTRFSKSGKDGRGDTSIWTDSPYDKADKARRNYLEAYRDTVSLASAKEQEKRNPSADMVNEYNKKKRAKSLVQKHQEATRQSRRGDQKAEVKEEEWAGEHPWRPWDREKDLAGGRQKLRCDTSSMAKGLASRFSSSTFQSSFL